MRRKKTCYLPLSIVHYGDGAPPPRLKPCQNMMSTQAASAKNTNNCQTEGVIPIVVTPSAKPGTASDGGPLFSFSHEKSEKLKRGPPSKTFF